MHHILVKVRDFTETECRAINGQSGWSFVPTSSHWVREMSLADQLSEHLPTTRSGPLLFGKGLLSTIGEQHRKQRKMLNPVFSIAHMRSMSELYTGMNFHVTLETKGKWIVPIFDNVVDQVTNVNSLTWISVNIVYTIIIIWQLRNALTERVQNGAREVGVITLYPHSLTRDICRLISWDGWPALRSSSLVNPVSGTLLTTW